MLQVIYRLGVTIYALGIRVVSPFVPKAMEWVKGRVDWQRRLETSISGRISWVWFHCASLGEFEQARSLIAAIHEKTPAAKILLTFFSPSGYTVRKDWKGADLVAYLPIDNPSNAKRFLDLINPKLAIFIRYDIWVNYLLEMEERKIPAVLVSARLSPRSGFLHSIISPLYREAFRSFDWIFCQDENTERELKAFTGKNFISVAGDTRFDRVVNLPTETNEVEGISAFVGDRFCIIAGSAYAKEIEWIKRLAVEWKGRSVCWIIAPHEIHPSEIISSVSSSSGTEKKFSDKNFTGKESILWIDHIGSLNRIYRYGKIAFIGGGWGKGIHNIQEPAAWGLPVLFGPKHEKFSEAAELIRLGGGFEVKNFEAFKSKIESFWNDITKLESASRVCADYVKMNSGATEKILEKLENLGLIHSSKASGNIPG